MEGLERSQGTTLRYKTEATAAARRLLPKEAGRRLLPRYRVAGLSDTMLRSRPAARPERPNNGAAVQTERQRARRADLSARPSGVGPRASLSARTMERGRASSDVSLERLCEFEKSSHRIYCKRHVELLKTPEEQ
ncbi:hypothetical protein EYF80_039135 [Liparis tanakae]|uniref:Uncharacterized protein n=1 Tax=Liparis tanakae TaxID=230148 RepID=A0A4Z2GC47_9TELE|nr:hypothetical protein EYF80_039135 [Liparis tanakae]